MPGTCYVRITMSVSSSNLSFILIVVLNVVQGTLTPNGNVPVDCGSSQRFHCAIPGEPIKWTTSGLRGISRGPFLARNEAYRNPRITSPDTGHDSQTKMSDITISGFSKSDNGGTIQCINANNNNNVRGMASISVGLRAPTNVVAKAETCNTVTLQWDQPSRPNDITTSVSCTPPSPGCAECTASPCTITGLNPSTEYEFTVTLNSVMCGTSMNTTGTGTRDLNAPANLRAVVESCNTVTLQWTQPSEPNDITASVSCAPTSPSCAECTTSPCTITDLNPSTEYVFTVTLDSSVCGTSSSKTEAVQFDSSSCVAPSPASLAALVLLLLLIPLFYPLGVLIVKYGCFRNKGYCEVFWCCGCFRKVKSAGYNFSELMKSLHHREEVDHQNASKEKHDVTYETMEQLGDDDEDVITDENVEHEGFENWITYADLDFSGHHKENIDVIHSVEDEVTYAAV